MTETKGEAAFKHLTGYGTLEITTDTRTFTAKLDADGWLKWGLIQINFTMPGKKRHSGSTGMISKSRAIGYLDQEDIAVRILDR